MVIKNSRWNEASNIRPVEKKMVKSTYSRVIGFGLTLIFLVAHNLWALPNVGNEMRLWAADGTELHRLLDQPLVLQGVVVTREAPFLAAVRSNDGAVHVWALPE